MSNIFENAYFGKSYKTRDQRKSLFLALSKNKYIYYIIDGLMNITISDLNGRVNPEFETDLDIVSEWE